MSIISEIGRRSLKVRIFMASVYVVLSLGAITMIYPFWLMVAGTSKSTVDSPESELIPSFLIDDTALYRKFSEGFFNESQSMMQMAYAEMDYTFRTMEIPDSAAPGLLDEWRAFQREVKLPPYFYDLAFLYCPTSKSTQPENLRRFKTELQRETGGSIGVLNTQLGTDFPGWAEVYVSPVNYVERRFNPGNTPYNLRYMKFKEEQPLDFRYYFSPEGHYKAVYLKAQYSKSIIYYNTAHGTKYDSWEKVRFPDRYPEGNGYTDSQRRDWEVYVRSLLNLLWIRADAAALPVYHDYLRDKYAGDIAVLNRLYDSHYKDFSSVPLAEGVPPNGVALSDWDSFIQGWSNPVSGKTHMIPIRMLRVRSIDTMFREALLAKYGTLEKLNAALGLNYKNVLDIIPPQRQANFDYLMSNKGQIRREFLKRNFIVVFEFIFIQGRAIANTVIYCMLAVFAGLIVNPLAAYALSRYRPPSTYKILLFMMLTMAFPPMVTQIPVFLMLREFNLLNTFAALVLPGLANGYSIFLLKGFFDSLPQELYESAELDGAGEFRIFWQITMSLSTPILAVISLQAFNHAYANFMMALLVCQDRDMWTLMPWLYQLQQYSGQGVVFSSLIIAAIPTFMIFLFCQNIIMRGIVVPVEK